MVLLPVLSFFLQRVKEEMQFMQQAKDGMFLPSIKALRERKRQMP
jgi:hypothetical protein